jgi:pimeloyl-ACP methyl ester carboxylesterase
MEIPVFLPTSVGSLAAVATLPADGSLVGPPVVWLPGGTNPRTRDPVIRQTARDIADRGQAMLRVDYPGCGLSGGSRLSDQDLLPVLLEACEWFRQSCGAGQITVGGSCRGAKLAIELATMTSHIGDVVSVSPPLGIRGRPRRRRKIRAGIAALDPVGSRMTPWLAGGDRLMGREDEEWALGVLQLLAAARARIAFIHGTEDPGSELYALLGDLPEDLAPRISVTVRKGAQLYGFKKIADMEWLSQVLAETFQRAPARSAQ